MSRSLCSLFVCAGLAVGSASAGQYTLGFERYTGYNDARDPMAGFSLCIDVNETEGYADFTFALDAASGIGTIKSIWFEDGSELEDVIAMTSSGQVDLREGRGSRNPAGANGELGWEGTETHFGRKGSAHMGVDAGESLTIRFEAEDEFFEEGLQALLSGSARIAFHLQRLGLNASESAHFVSTGGGTLLTVVPLPSAGALAGAGLLGLGTRRRR